MTVESETAELSFTIDHQGALKAVSLPRWGNPSGHAFDYVDFGGVVDEEARFGDYTIPSRLRVGYCIGTDRFERDGEFFRVVIDRATYR